MKFTLNLNRTEVNSYLFGGLYDDLLEKYDLTMGTLTRKDANENYILEIIGERENCIKYLIKSEYSSEAIKNIISTN